MRRAYNNREKAEKFAARQKRSPILLMQGFLADWQRGTEVDGSRVSSGCEYAR